MYTTISMCILRSICQGHDAKTDYSCGQLFLLTPQLGRGHKIVRMFSSPNLDTNIFFVRDPTSFTEISFDRKHHPRAFL